MSDANNITYEGNNLKLIQQGDGSEKTEYNYINGQLASEPSSYSTNVGPFVLSTLNSYTFSSNQNIACKILSFYQGINSSFKSGFEYDNKNSVFKNMNPYLKFLFNFESLDIKSNNNNVLKQFSHSTPTANDSTQSHYYTIIYNDNNFPISVKKHQFGNNELISECTISYN